MPKMTECQYRGKSTAIQEALEIRDDLRADNSTLDFRCNECGQPVRAHKKGGFQAAHFEHFMKNPDCSQSDSR